jgi:hypothetical protein
VKPPEASFASLRLRVSPPNQNLTPSRQAAKPIRLARMKTRQTLIIIVISTCISLLCYVVAYAHFVHPLSQETVEPQATEQMFSTAGSLRDTQIHEFPQCWFGAHE